MEYVLSIVAFIVAWIVIATVIGVYQNIKYETKKKLYSKPESIIAMMVEKDTPEIHGVSLSKGYYLVKFNDEYIGLKVNGVGSAYAIELYELFKLWTLPKLKQYPENKLSIDEVKLIKQLAHEHEQFIHNEQGKVCYYFYNDNILQESTLYETNKIIHTTHYNAKGV